MKQFFKGVILLIMLVACYSCISSSDVNMYDTERVETISSSRFLHLPYDRWSSNFSIFVDRETRVEYLFYYDGSGAGLTPLLDEEGKVVFYAGELPQD